MQRFPLGSSLPVLQRYVVSTAPPEPTTIGLFAPARPPVRALARASLRPALARQGDNP